MFLYSLASLKKQLRPLPSLHDATFPVPTQPSGGSLVFVCGIKAPGFSFLPAPVASSGLSLFRRLITIQQVCEFVICKSFRGSPCVPLGSRACPFICTLLAPSKSDAGRPVLGVSECVNELLTFINQL